MHSRRVLAGKQQVQRSRGRRCTLGLVEPGYRQKKLVAWAG